MRILSIDIGTSRVKAGVFSGDGEMLALESTRIERASNVNTQNAEEWFSILCALTKRLAEKKIKYDCVSLTGNMHALLGIGRNGEPVADALLWSDNSALRESDYLNIVLGDALQKEFMNRAIPVFTLPKLLMMRLKKPSLYEKSVTFLQCKDYIGFRLTGEFVTDPTDASGTLMMRMEDNSWAKDLLEALALDASKLPEIRPSSALRGKVTKNASALTGIPEGTPVVNGCGDLASAALGSACSEETLSLTLGTAGQMLSIGESAGARLAGKIFVFKSADPARELYLGSVPSGGFSFEYLASHYKVTLDEFFRESMQSALKEDLPRFLPYLLGRGAPYMDYAPSGAWFGLSAAHTRADLFAGAVFGALGALKMSGDIMQDYAGKRKRIVLQALAAREDAVRKTACALFEQRCFLPESPEASLLGGAVLGRAALEGKTSCAGLAEKMVRLRPSPDQPSEREKENASKLYRKFTNAAEALDGLLQKERGSL